jgi:hypothetical protein
MVTISSPKCWYELELYGTKYQKASIIDTAVKTFQRIEFFDHKLHPSKKMLSNTGSSVI